MAQAPSTPTALIDLGGPDEPRAHCAPRDPVAAFDLAGELDVVLERALEGLFRLGANRRFDQDQANAVGAVVTRAGYAALRSLNDRGPLSVRRLADACAMDAATASRQLQPLVEEGLVERRTVAGDARQVELALTPRGASVYARIVEYRLGQLTAVLEDWPASDRALLTTLVTRLSADLAGLPRRPRSPRPRRAPAGALC